MVQHVGQLQYRLAEVVTKSGDRYWRLYDGLIEPAQGLPIWASEIEWFLAALEDIAEGLILDAFQSESQEYPLFFRPTGMGAIILLLRLNHPTSELWIERWSASQRSKPTPNGVQFSTYWYCAKPFLTSSRLRLGLRPGWSESLRRLATGWREELKKAADSDWVTFRKEANSLPSEPPPPNRIVVTLPTPFGERRVQYYPFCPQPRDALVLKRPLRRVLLEAVGTPRTAHQVAASTGVVDEKTVRNELLWTARYEDQTLREAAFFSPLRVGNVDQLSATIRLPSFLADPLLVGLAPTRTESKSRDKIGPSPQQAQPGTQIRGDGGQCRFADGALCRPWVEGAPVKMYAFVGGKFGPPPNHRQISKVEEGRVPRSCLAYGYGKGAEVHCRGGARWTCTDITIASNAATIC